LRRDCDHLRSGRDFSGGVPYLPRAANRTRWRRHPARCEHRYGPQTHLPVITTPIDKLWKERVATPRAWGNAVEKLRRQPTSNREEQQRRSLPGRRRSRRSAANRRLLRNKQQVQAGRRNPKPTLALL